MKQNYVFIGVLCVLVMCGCAKEVGDDVEVEVKSTEHENRLINETSPYLLQHARNPVDWYAWGPEALAAAKKQGKPIFLSIGYSACHWCHVMERESFEDEATAAILNEHFIAIKVDREERPDLDAIYMSAVQTMTGSGGWPLNVFLTPDLKPFYGGTYFPPDDRYGRMSFKGVLTKVAEAWEVERVALTKSADGLTEAIQAYAGVGSDGGDIDRDAPENAVAILKKMFDRKRGGFGRAPKFPQASQLSFILRYHAAVGDEELLDMVMRTLDAMAYGGIYDQLGGGFHRYSVDADWLVPHFEKMLYDNALLAQTYLEAYQVTKKPLYARIARETLDYVIRDMTDGGGGFHAAEDADSEGEEGRFYVWSKAQIEEIVPADEAERFMAHYGVTASGNFEGHNILNVKPDQADESVLAELVESRQMLLTARARRIRPGRDYKVIAGWNGIMISALAKGHQVLGDRSYLVAAERAALFVKKNMTDGDSLARSYASGSKGGQGFLDDYANVANSYLDLYESTGKREWRSAAEHLAEAMVAKFGDKDGGGFYFSSGEDESLIMRRKDYTDGAIRSGNSVAALLLFRLARITGEDRYWELAHGILSAAGPAVSASPTGYMNMLSSYYFGETPIDIVIIGKPDADDTAALLSVVRSRFLPSATVIVADSSADGYDELQKATILLQDRAMIDGKATAYVCIGRACKQPVVTAEELEGQLRF